MKLDFAEYKRNLKIAYPVVLSQLGHISVGVADSIMVGALGGIPLAAATVGLSVYIPFMMLGIGISYGVSPLVAQADGDGNVLAVSSILKHSTYLNFFTGILLAFVLYLAAPLLWYLNQPEEVIKLTIPYFQIMAIGTIPLMVFQVYKQFAEGLGITRQAMFISIGGNIFNIILNYLFIFGKWQIPAMGVNGAAWATLIARVLMAVGVFAFVYYYSTFKKYWVKIKETSLSWNRYKELCKVSLPVGVQLTLEAGAFGFAAIMIGWLGAYEIAAHHIALNMAAIAYMAATGISAAATVRVGNEFGKKDYKALRKAGFYAFHIVLVFMSFSALLFVTLRFWLPTLYIDNPDVVSIASALLLISALFQLSDGIQVIGLGALRGINDVRVPTIIALLAYWVIGLPTGYVLTFYFNFGAGGVWYGLLIGLTVAAVLLFDRFNRKSLKLIGDKSKWVEEERIKVIE